MALTVTLYRLVKTGISESMALDIGKILMKGFSHNLRLWHSGDNLLKGLSSNLLITFNFPGHSKSLKIDI